MRVHGTFDRGYAMERTKNSRRFLSASLMAAVGVALIGGVASGGLRPNIRDVAESIGVPPGMVVVVAGSVRVPLVMRDYGRALGPCFGDDTVWPLPMIEGPTSESHPDSGDALSAAG